jgi:hypothetical protein
MIHNVHTREIDASPGDVAALMAALGGPDDRLWPAPAWLPMTLDGPLGVGAAGGHGSIRYRVTAYEPGHRVRFDFDPACGLRGYHELSVTPAGDHARVRHVLHGTARGLPRLLGPVLVRAHDAVVEDLLDNAERETTGTVRSPARWSPLVRLLQRTERPRPRAVAPPETATLVREAVDRYGGPGRIDLLDAYAVPYHPRLDGDPQAWADAIFRRPPRWVVALLALRQALVGLVGIRRDDGSAFATRSRTDDEVLLGTDAGHLDFRASVHVAGGRVVLTTVARTNNRRGRLYLIPVRALHPPVVRSMLARAHRALAREATSSLP